MGEYFRPYEGARPYLFVSYAHLDSSLVIPTIRVLHERLWRLWYDEGIPAGSDWTLNIASHMDGCAAVLLFFSQNVVASPNCTSEIRTAAGRGTPIMYVNLDGCDVTGEWAEYLSGATRIEAVPTTSTPSGRADAIEACPALTHDFLGTPAERQTDERSNAGGGPWTIAALAAGLLLVAALTALGLVATGRVGAAPQQDGPTEERSAQPAPEQPLDLSRYGDLFANTVRFPDAQQERAIRAVTGVRSGAVPADALLTVEELYFCGNMTPAGLEALAFDEDGSCLVNGVAVQDGTVSDLSLIAAVPSLKRLALVRQPVTDVSPLAALTRLQELSLAGGSVSDLSALAQLPSLTTLHLEHGAARDLRPLSAAPALTRVTVSADMFPLDLDPSAPFDVVLVR